jgi:dihydropteroate synthase
MGPLFVSPGVSSDVAPVVSPLRVGERWLRFDEPVIMGVVNVTPNSFSAGHTTDAAAAIAHGVQLWRDGAAILDIGGEATNPKAAPISAEEEWARIEPVVRGLAAAASGAILSVDTTKAEVAARAVAAGATIVNDVSGGRFDAAMIETVAELVRTHHIAYVASHLRGRTISEVFSAESADAAPLTKAAVVAELALQVAALPAAVRAASIVDPGLGFGKGAGELNLELMVSGGELSRASGRPVLIGPSRKRFLRRVLPESATAQDLDSATVGAALAAVRGGAQLLRIHAVALLRPALAVYIRK